VILPVILAGGSGTRLWPLSRQHRPKQLLKLTHERTMLQQTVLRLEGFHGVGPPMVICNDQYRWPVAEQLREIGVEPSAIFLEPAGRNTAPAVAVAALKGLSKDPRALILVLPADHFIKDIPAFHEALRAGVRFAEKGSLVTFGIVPDRPETGYGYIRRGKPADAMFAAPSEHGGEAFAIDAFVEKPDLETAKNYIRSGDYFWNSGMFLFEADAVLKELERFAPDILIDCEAAYKNGETDGLFFYLADEAFRRCRSESIDYAVMEKTDRGVVVPLEAGWDDLGSWEALWKAGQKDASGNVVAGDVFCLDAENSLIHAESRLVAVLGVTGLAVVETDDAVLVASLKKTQSVKHIVNALKADGRDKTSKRRKIHHPWGSIEALDSSNGVRVRKIVLMPGASVSVEGHSFRSVFWTRMAGTGRLRIGDAFTAFEADQPLRLDPQIPVGLENTGRVAFVFLEVLSGEQQAGEHLSGRG